jgi:hypothetical protein
MGATETGPRDLRDVTPRTWADVHVGDTLKVQKLGARRAFLLKVTDIDVTRFSGGRLGQYGWIRGIRMQLGGRPSSLRTQRDCPFGERRELIHISEATILGVDFDTIRQAASWQNACYAFADLMRNKEHPLALDEHRERLYGRVHRGSLDGVIGLACTAELRGMATSSTPRIAEVNCPDCLTAIDRAHIEALGEHADRAGILLGAGTPRGLAFAVAVIQGESYTGAMDILHDAASSEDADRFPSGQQLDDRPDDAWYRQSAHRLALLENVEHERDSLGLSDESFEEALIAMARTLLTESEYRMWMSDRHHAAWQRAARCDGHGCDGGRHYCES